jgi:hypothetical protein
MILPEHSKYVAAVADCGRLVEIAERAIRKLAFDVEGDDLEGENRKIFSRLARSDAEILGAVRQKWIR